MKKRKSPEINAGSMADIAFLLLIFFLVSTTIQTDAGINTILPPYEAKDKGTPKNKRNVFEVELNYQNQLLVENKAIPMSDVKQMKEQLKTFIMNHGKDPNSSDSPTLAAVTLKNDNGTSYDAYITVYNQIKAAYNELWEESAQGLYGLHYEDLDEGAQAKIRAKIPLVISEVEPTSIAKN